MSISLLFQDITNDGWVSMLQCQSSATKISCKQNSSKK